MQKNNYDQWIVDLLREWSVLDISMDTPELASKHVSPMWAGKVDELSDEMVGLVDALRRLARGHAHMHRAIVREFRPWAKCEGTDPDRWCLPDALAWLQAEVDSYVEGLE
jgi:hypothetical protein